MIFGIGTDIVEIARIEKATKASERFALRILTQQELESYYQSKQQVHFLAKRFAAKEALVKAMGTGIGRGVSWHMMQIEHNELGKPLFRTFEGVNDFFLKNHIHHCHLTISDELNYATATVLLETT